ncbi:hypothetical protein D5S17_36030 [Pseudonocardiaceae bacterium YIM PH 21723]|nr:hypothetical protein D5S17_36030 [Pseudonocardiaceae bacterium YIM PH 21723]
MTAALSIPCAEPVVQAEPEPASVASPVLPKLDRPRELFYLRLWDAPERLVYVDDAYTAQSLKTMLETDLAREAIGTDEVLLWLWGLREDLPLEPGTAVFAPCSTTEFRSTLHIVQLTPGQDVPEKVTVVCGAVFELKTMLWRIEKGIPCLGCRNGFGKINPKVVA